MGLRGFCVSLTLGLASPAWSEQAKPLVDLAAQLPAPPEWTDVRLVDLASARRQMNDLADGEPLAHPLQYVTALYLPDTLSGITLIQWPADKLEAIFGFRPEAITALAGWKSPRREALMTLRGGFDEQTIDTALMARGYAIRDGRDGPVWHRELSVDHLDEPFSTTGRGVRLALRGEVLLYSQHWSGMEKQLGKGDRLGDDVDVVAFLDIAYEGLFPGVPLQLHVLEIDTFDAPGFPLPSKMGLVYWQDGTEMTAALLLSYANAPRSAAAAAAIIESAMDRQLPLGLTLAESLGDSISVNVLERHGRTLVVLSTTSILDRSEALSIASLYNPHLRMLITLGRGGLESVLATE